MLEATKIRVLIVCAVFSGGVPAAVDAGPEPISDVRVLIDVSGSMKQNDPGNIRIPALKLLVNLLPPESRAGVWLFAAEPALLVPIGNADGAWQVRALKSASSIHSRGLFTDIEEALEAAMQGWASGPEKNRRSIILLTDGVVDISKDPKVNAASRTAIIERIIPGLTRHSTQVHTIALSQNADHELLKKLSSDTGGWSQTVQSAKQLERAFLAMFKKAVPRDRVPLTDNKFSIDAGIDEFSVLVFRESAAQPTRLISPGQKQTGQDDHAENIRWHHEASYDLITVERPEPGEWRLLAGLDPDNQVMVVTDLKLRLNELPNTVGEHATVDFSVSITEKGETVTNPDFLSLINNRLQQSAELGGTLDRDLKADPANSGTFRHTIEKGLRPGKYTFKVVAKSPTFQREAEHRIEVVAEPADQKKPDPAKDGRDQARLPKEEPVGETPEPDWMITWVITGAVNLIFLLAGFFVYRWIQKRMAQQQMELINRLET